MIKSGILEVQPEDLKEPLTDEQKSEIANHNDNLDWGAEEEKLNPDKIESKADDKKPEDVEKEVDKEEAKKPDDEAKKAEEDKAADEERIAKLAEEKGKTVEEIKKEEEESQETPEQIELKRLEEIAKEDGITVDEVKEAEAKDKSVIENYDSDINKVAKALRKENSAYGKLKAENESLHEYKKVTERQKSDYSEKALNQELEGMKDGLVEEYIKNFPGESEDSDDVLFERAKVIIKENIKVKKEQAAIDLDIEADKSREGLISKLPEEYKDYVPEIKGILKDEAAEVVMSKDFDIMNLAYWARGKKFTPGHVKSLEDAAYKRGAEQPEIKSKKANIVSSGDRGTDKTVVNVNASEKDKIRANEVFAGKEDWSEEKKVEEYMKTQKQNDDWS